MGLLSKRVGLMDTENAFKIGPYIRTIEEQGRKVIKCNLGEPDFPVPQFIKEEVKRQIDQDNTHYCDPQGILTLRVAVAKHLSETRGIRATPDRKSFGRIGTENLHYLRISIATDTESLKEGVIRIQAASQDKEGFRLFIKRGEHLY